MNTQTKHNLWTPVLLATGITISLIAAAALIGTQVTGASAKVSPEIKGTWLVMVSSPYGSPP